jgi:UDP-N-acetylglucosamine--N-acetylmuramyl-(pentapeptide) pyrophosphoryl-undecaprenol N-acetylglucosamine transferase
MARIVIACGGTGGHVIPGLATGRVLRQRGHAVSVWLSGRGVEGDAAAGWDGPLFRTGARPLGLKTLPAFCATLWRAWRQLRREKPDVLLAMGCYSSVAPALAAGILGVPVVLHEANAVPGKAVVVLSRRARVTALSFAGSDRWLPGRRTVCTGMPVRADLAPQPLFDGFGPGRPPAVLVTGGSLGAHAVNELASEAFARLHVSGFGPLRVIHQCGAADETFLRARYAASGVHAGVHAFLREMGRALASVDLVVARAGAATCAELCLCGVPALLIPLPTAVRDHQRLNAEALAAAGGAVVCGQAGLTPDALAEEIARLLRDAPRRGAMRAALLSLARPDAAGRLADLVLEQASKTP